MKNKKILLVISFFLIFTIGLIYFALTMSNKETNINLLDRQWIVQNKNAVFDACILNDIPTFTKEGEGVVFEILESINDNLDLSLNKTPYTEKQDRKCDIKFTYRKEVKKYDFVLLVDDYVVVSKNSVTHTSSSDFSGITIGINEQDVSEVTKYLSNTEVNYRTFETFEEMNTDLLSEEPKIDAYVVPKLKVLEQLINKELFINYIIGEMDYNFVIEFGENKRLNEILEKYITVWFENNFNDSYQEIYTNNYFQSKEISEKEKSDFFSKSYIYGFVEDKPYDVLFNGKPSGINSYIVNKFSEDTKTGVIFKSFANYDALYKAFNGNKIDFMVEQVEKDYDLDIYRTTNIHKNNYVILSNASNHVFINSLKSLTDKPLVIKDSYVVKYLEEEKIKYKEYNNLETLIKNSNKSSLIVLDENTYLENQHSLLKDSKPIYNAEAERLDFVFRDTKANKVFNEKFSYFISGLSPSITLQEAYYDYQMNMLNKNLFLTFIIMSSTVLAIIISVITLSLVVKHKNRTRKTITKEDKLKYIDMLTALKNRHYLTDNIEEWDDCDIYPQSVIVVDLNNIAYINDNFGHAEGDKVIKEAANILIKTQIDNSELIRTSGNEFLIYLVGYEEKDIIAYKRRLMKELKKLTHDFGAAIGYSMINSAIKTIDDAVNEAALDMRNDKENQEY